MSQVWEIGDINPTTTSPLTDISRLTRSMDALHSLFSGPSSPQVTVPYMFWADTAEGILKRRNAENSSWVFALSLTESYIKNINASYNTLVTDNGSMLLVDAVSTPIVINLVSASSARAGSVISIKKIDNTTNIVNLSPNASETIDGDLNYIIQITHETIILRSDGSNWRVVNLYRPKVVLTKTANYLVTRADDTAILNINLAVSNVALPIITTVYNGFTVTIKKLIAGTTTIVPTGTFIDGITSKVLTALNQVVTVISNGTAWFIINEANAPITFPSQSFASIPQAKAQAPVFAAMTPNIMYYSPVAVQVSARFNTVSGVLIYGQGCTISKLSLTKIRLNFTNPYVTSTSYAVTMAGISDAFGLATIVLTVPTISSIDCQNIESQSNSVLISGQLI